MITLTATAAQEIRRLQATQTPSTPSPPLPLRLQVKPGGCASFYYDLSFSSTQDGDQRYESQGIEICVDPESDRHLQDLRLDYSEDLMGGGFRFHNPNAANTCGCGHSFSPSS
ncbi:iron-sulfur cluster assembly accessory protein [Spirulina subsalsa FACHB-351]|uniref:Iron-sulfur cluster assembly accessory protein n=1 Tax=Spirulina subsalsa FACHB-351 TaxID=234711 RepID=A0ABT3L8T0_9CYAN|nr:iron-sulfur cluster assembly accessory protein [Spirulina subsalsa]MCW6037918.1 iron-sulfur cluster assembly accessory protein [Spirulina subsalsa FACHB-351]